MKLLRNLQQLGGLVLLAGLAACGGGGGGDATGTHSSGNTTDGQSNTGISAKVDNSVLQWRVATPIQVSMSSASGSPVLGALRCQSANATALEVASDCSSATALRLGSYDIQVSDTNGQTAKLTVRNTPQRHALMASSQAERVFSVVSSSGTPWFWGSGVLNRLAQFSDNTLASATDSSRPLLGKVNSVTKMVGVVSVSSGSAAASSLALTESGDVWSWSGDGQTLGRAANTLNQVAKVQTSATGSPLGNIVQVQVGDRNAAALRDDGLVYAWGWSEVVGQGSKVGSSTYPALVQVSAGVPLSDVVQISAGQNFTMALTRSGEVYVWGANESLQLANPDGSRSSKLYTAIKVLLSNTQQPLQGIVSVAAGGNHALALTADGRVYAWGSNFYGQLGRGFASVSLSALGPDLVKAPGGFGGDLRNIKAISVGQYHNLVLSDSGSVYSWGSTAKNDARLGQSLLSGENDLYPRPVVNEGGIGLLRNIASISATTTNSYALDNTGAVLSWGLNHAGALGTGVNYLQLPESGVPQKVVGTTGDGLLNVDELSAFKNLSQRYR